MCGSHYSSSQHFSYFYLSPSVAALALWSIEHNNNTRKAAALFELTYMYVLFSHRAGMNFS
jgi:hypothetical protein